MNVIGLSTQLKTYATLSPFSGHGRCTRLWFSIDWKLVQDKNKSKSLSEFVFLSIGFCSRYGLLYSASLSNWFDLQVKFWKRTFWFQVYRLHAHFSLEFSKMSPHRTLYASALFLGNCSNSRFMRYTCSPQYLFPMSTGISAMLSPLAVRKECCTLPMVMSLWCSGYSYRVHCTTGRE